MIKSGIHQFTKKNYIYSEIKNMLLNKEKISLYLRYYSTFPFKKFVKAYLSEISDNFPNN